MGGALTYTMDVWQVMPGGQFLSKQDNLSLSIYRFPWNLLFQEGQPPRFRGKELLDVEK